MIYATFAPENRDKLRAAVAEELARAVKDGFTPAEVETAKRALLELRRNARAQDGAVVRGLMSQAYLDRTWAFAAETRPRARRADGRPGQRGAAQVPEARRLLDRRGGRLREGQEVAAATIRASGAPRPRALAMTGARTVSPPGPGNGPVQPPASSTSSSPAIASHADSSSST